MSMLNGSVIHQLSRDELIHLLESIHGPKDIFVDSALMKPLDRIAGASVLKEHGVQRIFRLASEGGPAAPPAGSNQRVYLAHASTANALLICRCVGAALSANGSDASSSAVPQHHAIFVPKVMNMFRLLVEAEGLHNSLALYGYNMGPVALDVDLWSFELPAFFTAHRIDGDTSLVQPLARWLHRLQSLCGPIARMFAVGSASQQVLAYFDMYDAEELRHKMSSAQQPGHDRRPSCSSLSSSTLSCSAVGDVVCPSAAPAAAPSEIACMLLMDRSVDYVSALLTQLTYAGLLSETFKTQCGVAETVTAGAAGAGDGGGGVGTARVDKLVLHSRDEVYEEIRDLAFSAAFSRLSARTKTLNDQHNSRQDMGIADMKSFIQGELRATQAAHRSLSAHIGVCEVLAAAAAGDGGTAPAAGGGAARWLLEPARLSCEQSLVDAEADCGHCLPYLQQLLALQAPLAASLRLLCLCALTGRLAGSSGLARHPSHHVEQLVEQLVASYGYRQLLTVHRLVRLGLLPGGRAGGAQATGSSGSCSATATVQSPAAVKTSSTSSSSSGGGWQVLQRVAGQAAAAAAVIGSGVAGGGGGGGLSGAAFHAAARRLRLVPQQCDSATRQQSPPSTASTSSATGAVDSGGASYVFGGGYVPLVCRLLEAAIDGDPAAARWRGVETALRQLLADSTEAVESRLSATATSTTVVGRDTRWQQQPRTVCVVLLGGATLAELAALQWTARRSGWRVMLITTAVVTGSTLLEAVIER